MFLLDWVMEANPEPVRGEATLVWQRQADNRWKIILQTGNFALLAKK
jgi:hypothetical protein